MRVATLSRPGRPGTRPASVGSMTDLAHDLRTVLDLARDLKRQGRRGLLPPLLAGRAVVLVLERNSTRTRVSFEIGIQRLGGVVSTLDQASSQLSRGESLEDTAAVLGRYGDAIVHRARSHEAFLTVARHAGVPVINALTDREHPCQVLADWMALEERWGALEGRTFAYVGDGNNMCHSYLLGAPLAGMDVRVATPRGYAPEPAIVAEARRLAAAAGTRVEVLTDPRGAVRGADAVATDTWVSMGDDEETERRLRDFRGFTVDEALLARAAPGAVFLHCLPGHWGQEATEGVAHGPRSLVYDQAEDRMWTQMALLVHLLRPARPAA